MKTFLNTLLVIGVTFATMAQEEVSPKNAVETNIVSIAALVSNVTQTTHEMHQSPVTGKKTNERISSRLRKELLGHKVGEVMQSNIVVRVDCGDPSYHIAIDIGDGAVTNLTVRVTPICLQ